MANGSAARTPCVRARYMQTFARHIDRLRPEDRDAIRAAVSPDIWLAVDSAGLLGWVPVQMNLDCTRAVAARLGVDRTHQFFRDLLLATTDTPLLRGFVQAVLRVTVSEPSLYLPWVARGFELMFRDAGRWRVLERKPGWALLEITGMPHECVTDSVWLRSVASALSGLQELANLDGTVVVREVSVKTGTATFAMRSTARS